MNFYQRAKGNDNWIKRFGCAFLSVLKTLDDILELSQDTLFTPNDWLDIFKKFGIINEDGLMVWQKIAGKFPVTVETHLYNGKHYHPSFITNNSIVSVDGMEKQGYQSHYLAVEEVRFNKIIAYDPWFDRTENIMNEYGKETVEDTIFTAVNLERV